MKESKRARADRAVRIAAALAEWYPDDNHGALAFQDPFELLVATILSAQCTDVKVNEVAPALFLRFPDVASLAGARQEDVEALIHATGFFRNKARSLLGCAEALQKNHGGKVPDTMDALTALPGVGRKTANVVLSTCFGQPGIIVDTHVSRLSQRLGLTLQDDPERIESDLQVLLPKTSWTDFCHRLTWLGRRVCVARKPRCDQCRLKPDCPTGRLA